MARQTPLCPNCLQGQLMLKYEATYVYSYLLDSSTPGTRNKNEFLSFQYDKREKVEEAQFIKCEKCGYQVPCVFSPENNQIDIKQISDSLRLNMGDTGFIP